MEWDLGPGGVALLLAAAATFAVVAQLAAWKVTRWMWLIGGGTYFVAGLLISEGLFGWATEEDLQPNVDGLSVDEALGLGILVAIAAVAVTWWLVRHWHAGAGAAPGASSGARAR